MAASKKAHKVLKVYVIVATSLFSLWLMFTVLNLAATTLNIVSNGACKLYKVAVQSVPSVRVANK